MAEREGIRTPEWLPTTISKLIAALANGDLSEKEDEWFTPKNNCAIRESSAASLGRVRLPDGIDSNRRQQPANVIRQLKQATHKSGLAHQRRYRQGQQVCRRGHQ